MHKIIHGVKDIIVMTKQVPHHGKPCAQPQQIEGNPQNPNQSEQNLWGPQRN